MKGQIILMFALITAMLSFQASAGCGHWVIRENTDYLTDPIFDEVMKSSPGDKVSSKIENQVNQSVQPEPSIRTEPKVSDISGKWLLKMDESLESSLNLILIRSDDRLQGYGNLVEKGLEATATAIGSISYDAVSLEIKLDKLGKKYKMNLTWMNNTLEGSYGLYNADRLTRIGNVAASRSGL